MTPYQNLAGLENVDALWFSKVEDAAFGLSEDEVLMLLSTPRSKLNEVELETFKLAWEIGRARGKKTAVDNLFGAMRDKGGHQAALAYLVRFSDKWSEEGSGVPATGQFTFTVNKTA